MLGALNPPRPSQRPIVLLALLACLAVLVVLNERVSGMRRPALERVLVPPEPEPEPPGLAPPPLSEPVLLRFAWPESGVSRVAAEHRRDGRETREAFELHWRPLPEVGSILETYPLPDAAFDPAPPGPGRASGTVLTPVQAVLSTDGRFVCTPRLDDLRDVWSDISGHRFDVPVPEPLAERWSDWVERWIGVALAPGERLGIPAGNERGNAWITCLGLDLQRVHLQYRLVRPRNAATDEIGCALERVVDAELFHDGLRPHEVRVRSRWTWSRGKGQSASVVRVTEHEDRYAFDWSAPARDGAISDELPAVLESWAGRLWPALGEEERRADVDGWRALWTELSPPRRSQIRSAASADAAILGAGRSTNGWWRERRPELQRLWQVEGPLDPPDVPIRTWMENGPPESSVDVLFIGDGYTAEELTPSGKYWIDVWRVAQFLLEEAPLSWYRDWFNVRALFLESKESGCDLSPEVDEVDTALDACFEGDDQRGLLVRNEARLSQLLQLAGKADVVFVMVNGNRCSGTAMYLSDLQAGSSPRSLATFCTGCPQPHEVAAHELGHAFANLVDEYVDEELARVRERIPRGNPNVTRDRRPSSAPWKHFLALPGAERFTWHHEGAYYREKGLFRPWPRCRMCVSGDPFCPVCCEAVARAIFRTCGLEWDDAEYHRAHPLALWELERLDE